MSLLRILLIFLIVGVGFAQNNDDVIEVKKTDWEFIKKTALELDSALVECENLNTLYENRMSEFQMQVYDLTKANQLADTIIVLKNEQLEKRKEQISILNRELNKKKVEIWVYRGGGILLLIVGGILAVN